ncbi:MAG: AtpZ/AtpI family protein [Cytophagales bacterium]|jgi:F0F1-type ATP synthase assembly protein I|nr:AtpZ/AtpI family protein [Cytophagales bacterium]MCA6365876.1 AtpZ/AtpI family protein [Cytophagales bacterium]MCA6371272.1 AtpZ/AtpI family protein [Cytophagales bacterium]MCA6374960.1 AtpZ/AtpI family protein [Cytophagales bacterium]MCA6382731.1 AtpZ/AtpI family protein [Cytophagales bacterium]
MSREKEPNLFLKYSSLGIQLLATIGFFGWLGFKIDQYFSFTFPLFLLLFVFASFGGMIYRINRSINE